MATKTKSRKPAKAKPTKSPESPEPVQPETPEPVDAQEPVQEAEPEVAPQDETPEPETAAKTPEPVAQDPTAAPARPLVPVTRDPRLPPMGTEIARQYKGRIYAVTVLEDGFLYEGQRYGSLSKVAKLISNQSVNGFVWWKLGYKDGKRPSTGLRLAERRIAKLERLTARMRVALEEGKEVLAEAETELASLREKAEQLAPKS